MAMKKRGKNVIPLCSLPNVSGDTQLASSLPFIDEDSRFSMPVEMQLSRIIISEINESQYVFLKEVDGDRQFPILIGIFEATSIDRRVKKVERPRPLTHDLIVGVAESLGGEMDSVVISDLKKQTYFAKLRIRRDGELIEIDARPSDALAVAVTADPPLPIWVDENVINEAIASL